MKYIPKQHVASGSFCISRNFPLILQAFLGTCVGVAVYDEVAGVGGLIHLLLPEPVTEESSYQPEKYASTGLPIFLNSLYDKGASKERLKVFIAGGALVGPIASQDLLLDIGGRTVENTMIYLMEEKIHIEKSETGGLFTCCLNLDLRSWDCYIEPIGNQKLSQGTVVTVPSVNEIEQVIECIQPIPQVVLKILRMINQEEQDIKKLTDEIRQDQVICAKALKLCNSALFSCARKIDSLDHALAFLGIKNLFKLVISSALGDFYNRSTAGYSMCKGGLYHHAVGTAIIAEKLADLTARVTPGLAYTAGLLHDIGKVVLDQFIASAYPLFYRQLFENGTHFLEAENKILGIDHTKVGCDLAVRWSLPDSLIDAIKCHHDPEAAVHNIEVAHIVYLADLIMSRFHAGLELELLSTEGLSSKLKAIGLSIESLCDIVDSVPAGAFRSEPTPSFSG